MENIDSINSTIEMLKQLPNRRQGTSSTLGLLLRFKRIITDIVDKPGYNSNEDEELILLAKKHKVSFLIVKKDGVVMYGMRGETK